MSVQVADESALFRRYRKTGSRRVRNEIVELHRHLADQVARRYRSRGLSYEDLRQTALVAMVRAVDRYDPDQGASFATFVGRTMDGELKRALRDKAWAVRPPRAAQERHLRLRRGEEELTHRLGRAPTIAELAESLDLSVDEVLEAIEAGSARVASGVTRTDDDGDEVEVGAALHTNDSGFGLVEDQMLIRDLIAQLDPRSQEIVHLRFFERLGQEEIAQRLGVSQSYLSRMLRKILIELRGRMGEDLILAAEISEIRSRA